MLEFVWSRQPIEDLPLSNYNGLQYSKIISNFHLTIGVEVGGLGEGVLHILRTCSETHGPIHSRLFFLISR
ncbi:MAG: hypothetical protein CM15mP6_1270 [Methanobacteriota archaeon]|nr:MAG: hypothetical protein CM15mP6_1270 [Euryarchaeota archaeon]